MHTQTSYLPPWGFDRVATEAERSHYRARSAGSDGTPRMEATAIVVGLVFAAPLWFGIGWAVLALAR